MKKIKEKILFFNESFNVGVFIGFNCFKVIKLREIVVGRSEDFYVVWIFFGWCIVGLVNFFDI